MKNVRFLFVFILLAGGIFSLYSQDVITLKNGDEIKAKVLEISSTEIRYKRFENQNGPTIVVSIAEVFAINYENGTREVYNTTSSTTSSTASSTVSGIEAEKPPATDPNKLYIGFYANPVGFLTFGPMVGVELTYNRFIGELNVRLPTLGFLMPYMDSWEYGDETTITSGIGIGVGAKFFNPTSSGGFYVGGFLEYGMYKSSRFSGNGESATIAAAANVGYKFIWSPGIYLRLGGYVGAAYGIKYDWTGESGYKEDDSGSVTIFGLFDFSGVI